MNGHIYIGGSITSTSVSATGTGILGGNDPIALSTLMPGDDTPPSSVTVGGGTYPLRPTSVAPLSPTGRRTAPAAAERTDWRVIVTPEGDYYTVKIYNGAREVLNPGVKMTARMNFTLPDGWEADAIFAVFRNADGSLTAFKAAYDPVAGTLTFHTDCTGTFALVSFPFEGKLYSADFYTALGELESIQKLPVRR